MPELDNTVPTTTFVQPRCRRYHDMTVQICYFWIDTFRN